MNIIICDDRIDDRKNLSDLLSDYGEKKNYEFAITEYDSGEQLCEEQSALEACQLLFLDINMQGMDGLKTAMRIKEKYPKLPVVLVTAYMRPNVTFIAYGNLRICKNRVRKLNTRPTPMIQIMAGTPQMKLLTALLIASIVDNILFFSFLRE